MSTTNTTNARLREKAFDERRKADYFLPWYSDFYFEKKNSEAKIQIIFFIYLAPASGMISLISDMKNIVLNGLFLFSIVALIYLLKIRPRILDSRKTCGTFFYKNTAVRIDINNNEIPIPYSLLELEISEGHIQYGETGLEIGSGENKLVFHYEIGDAEAQAHVEQCYDELQRHLNVPLLPYEKNGLDLLDRRYFYEKSRRNQTISLFCALFLFLCFYKIKGISTMTEIMFLGIIFGLWECISIYMLFKNALLTQQNYDAFRHRFRDYPDARFGRRNAGLVCFITVTALTVLFNLCMILS